MHRSNSFSLQPFPGSTLIPPLQPPPPPLQPPPPYGYGLPSKPGSAAAIHPNVIYVQHFSSPGTKPTHETSWSTSMWGCCSDMNNCLVTAACPCITAGRIAEIVSEGKTSCEEGVIIYALCSVMCMHSIYTCHTRSKMRRQHMLKGNNCRDCLAHTYCMACALCQEYRQLNHLGLDPGIGWHENVEREKHAVAVFKITPPLVEGGMKRESILK